MPAKGHEVTRIITSAENLWDYVVYGLLGFLGVFSTVGAETVAFPPYFPGFVLIRAALYTTHGLFPLTETVFI